MNRDEIVAVVNEKAVEALEVRPEALVGSKTLGVLKEEFGLDSLPLVELAIVLEETFGITLTEAQTDLSVTLDDLYTTIERLLAQPSN